MAGADVCTGEVAFCGHPDWAQKALGFGSLVVDFWCEGGGEGSNTVAKRMKKCRLCSAVRLLTRFPVAVDHF